MPQEPDPTRWVFPTPGQLVEAEDLVAFGADLAPGTLLAAYRAGLFPMPGEDELCWFSPVERGVLALEDLRVSKSLRRSMRDFEIRIDSAFDEVIAACADPRREGSWIDAEISAAYRRLHHLGWAHSVEAWREGELAGGLYGVAIGGLFAGESMFHRVTDASKVALVALVGVMGDQHAGDRLLDVQWRTPHLASLGVSTVSRAEYLHRLERALPLPLPAAFEAA